MEGGCTPLAVEASRAAERAQLVESCENLAADIEQLRATFISKKAEALQSFSAALREGPAASGDGAEDEAAPGLCESAPTMPEPSDEEARVVICEEVDRSQIHELVARLVKRQRGFLAGLRAIYRLSFILVRAKDGSTRSGVNIGSLPVIGFDLPARLPVAHAPHSLLELRQIVNYRCIDLEMILLLQKQQETTLGACTLLCDLLMNVYKVITPIGGSFRSRLKQRRGRYYFCRRNENGVCELSPGEKEAEETLLTPPTDRKSFTQQSEFYVLLLALVEELAQYAYNTLRLPRQGEQMLAKLGPPLSEDLFLLLCYVFENV